MEDFDDQYQRAIEVTNAAKSCGLVAEAAALAHQIRWNPEQRRAYNYPAGMDLAVTCCCHIVVDDDNLADGHVAFCIQQAAQQEHPDCLRLALLLARASMTQRRKISHRAWFD